MGSFNNLIQSPYQCQTKCSRHDFHFPGHLLPGTAFILMGFWWIYNALRIHYSREDLDSDEYPDCEGGPLNVDAGVKYGSRKRARTIFTATYNGEMPGLLYCEGFYKVGHLSCRDLSKFVKNIKILSKFVEISVSKFVSNVSPAHLRHP